MDSSNQISISKLKLTNFRNYQSSSFNFKSEIIAIYGNNGVGKTNILEAITLLSKGRGLRSADLDQIVNVQSDNFTIYSEIKNHPEIENIGTSCQKSNSKRIFQINNDQNSKIKNYPTIIWLTPQMDGIFIDSKSVRRKFLDKIVCDIDSNHSSRINAYDKHIRERMNLLQKYDIKSHQNWLDIIEGKIVELGSAIANARNEAVEYLNKAILLNESNFIKTKIKIIGELEELALNKKAILVEEEFSYKLKENRNIDTHTGRTTFGTHRSEFTAILLNKNIEAKLCSTGEQKSILIALTFARIKILSFFNLPPAILLLDEIASHLDPNKKKELFRELSKIQNQCFLTATNQEVYSQLVQVSKKSVDFLEIK